MVIFIMFGILTFYVLKIKKNNNIKQKYVSKFGVLIVTLKVEYIIFWRMIYLDIIIFFDCLYFLHI